MSVFCCQAFNPTKSRKCWMPFSLGLYVACFLWQLRVGKDLRLSGAAVRRAITRNTVLVVASSPGFPHGCVDHVRDIAAVSLVVAALQRPCSHQ